MSLNLIHITIDNRKVEVPAGTTILDAARKLNIEIPTLCFLEGYPANTSCMVCVVKVNDRPTLLPACATKVEEGMRVESETPEIHEARKTALELLLSDHAGDCIGPCHAICPAKMDIPRMIRQIAANKLDDAIQTVKADIPLPAVLGRICPAPCEKGCRRGAQDDPVAICLLKRYVADVDLASDSPYLPRCEPDKNKPVAIIGAGPAGLSATYYLRLRGYPCTVFDDHEKLGGMLQYGLKPEELDRQVLDSEIDLIIRLGVEFQLKTRIGKDISLDEIQKDFAAVFVAFGQTEPKELKNLGLPVGKNGIATEKRTGRTEIEGIFAGGAVVRQSKMAVRSVADGKNTAYAIDQYLSGKKIVGLPEIYTTHIGKLKKNEIHEFMKVADSAGRIIPQVGAAGFSEDEARREARRCLHCDCRKPIDCKLRIYAQQYHARTSRFKGERRNVQIHSQHPDLYFEPGKCIDCGICIQIAAQAKEELGLTFIGRGFDVKVTVPFDESIASGLTKVALQCVQACPTGALSDKTSTDISE
jgi:glutamate synthase (NADPH) small chain